ncbi:MAG: adenylate/guanylate cyclase domain-containing protein [Candidatus Brocadiae bacterium]|nr:adenylate/guanylate cyclase domain-containing protein [Candidatus Brocadiia bacterium]
MPAPPGDRRPATILFADISGFTTLSERMDPEDVRDVIDALFRRFRIAIEQEGGTIDKFIGDAVMAIFGAPTPHADDPARAVRAALALQDEIARFNAGRTLDLRLRVGVHAGEILWGSVAGDRPTAMGDAVTLAQKVEGACEPGCVLVTRSVERAVAGSFRMEGREGVKVKGRDGELEVFEITGAL